MYFLNWTRNRCILYCLFFSQLLTELTPVERMALKHVEFREKDWRQDQIDAAEYELAAQKRQLEEDQRRDEEEREAFMEQQEAELNESTEDEVDEDESEGSSSSSSDSEDDEDESEEEEEDDDDDESEANEDGEVQGEDVVKSPRTRSRGDVKINLWTLDE